MKKKIPTIILYALIIMILCIPWLSIGGKSCNVFWFILQLCIQGMDNIIIKSGITYVDATPPKVGMIIELILVIVYIAGVLCYLIKIVRGKSSGLNKLNFCISIPLLVVHMSGISLGTDNYYGKLEVYYCKKKKGLFGKETVKTLKSYIKTYHIAELESGEEKKISVKSMMVEK